VGSTEVESVLEENQGDLWAEEKIPVIVQDAGAKSFAKTIGCSAEADRGNAGGEQEQIPGIVHRLLHRVGREDLCATRLEGEIFAKTIVCGAEAGRGNAEGEQEQILGIMHKQHRVGREDLCATRPRRRRKSTPRIRSNCLGRCVAKRRMVSTIETEAVSGHGKSVQLPQEDCVNLQRNRLGRVHVITAETEVLMAAVGEGEAGEDQLSRKRGGQRVNNQGRDKSGGLAEDCRTASEGLSGTDPVRDEQPVHQWTLKPPPWRGGKAGEKTKKTERLSRLMVLAAASTFIGRQSKVVHHWEGTDRILYSTNKGATTAKGRVFSNRKWPSKRALWSTTSRVLQGARSSVCAQTGNVRVFGVISGFTPSVPVSENHRFRSAATRKSRQFFRINITKKPREKLKIF